MSGASTRRIGALLLVIYAVHTVVHLARDEASDMLWTCNVAVLLIAIGCVFIRPLPIAVGVSWLTFATPVWLADLCTGGVLLVTSFATHFGGLLLGTLAIHRLGWPRRSWMTALAALMALGVLTRLTTSATANVNLAFAVWQGWEGYFPNHALYLLLLLSVATATFVIVEIMARRLIMEASETTPTKNKN